MVAMIGRRECEYAVLHHCWTQMHSHSLHFSQKTDVSQARLTDTYSLATHLLIHI